MTFSFPDGTCWELDAGGRRAERLLSRFSEVLLLHGTEQRGAGDGPLHSYLVSYEGDCLTLTRRSGAETSSLPSTLRFPLRACADLRLCSKEPEDRAIRDLVVLSLLVGARVQSGGGVLFHGALAEREGEGVLLLGPSGRGKTTASARLPPPWRSLSDDMALVIPRKPGSFSAHAWPTWSRMYDGGGGSWDVCRQIGLGGLFFLVRGVEDSVERIGPGRAMCLLVESFEQAWSNGRTFFSEKFMLTIRRSAFDNIGFLAKSVPAFVLQTSLTGQFWERIEEALGAAPVSS